MAKANPHGFDPVARFEEMNGDVLLMADDIAGSLDDEYEIVSVLHGDLYLCEVVSDGDGDEPYWMLSAEVREGKTGAWDSASDKAAKSFPESYFVVEALGASSRYVVWENE